MNRPKGRGMMMTSLFGRWAVAAACVASGVVHAEVQTLGVGDEAPVSGWSVAGGGATFRFSPVLVNVVNLTRSVMAEVQPADLGLTHVSTTSAAGTVTTRLQLGSLAAPMTSLTGEVGDDTVAVQSMSTEGGFTFTTIKNGATNGYGFLSVTNLKIDLLSKKVYADISGGNGVGTLNGYHLWSFNSLSEPLVLSREGHLTPGYTFSSNEVTTSGLFTSTATLDMLQKALNLNNTGRSALNTMNDPSRNGGLGFGTFVLTAVPEPSTYALMCAGVVGVGLMARRARRRADALGGQV